MHSFHNLLYMTFNILSSIFANPTVLKKHLHHCIAFSLSSLLERFYGVCKQMKLLAKLDMLKGKITSCRWHIVRSNGSKSILSICRRISKNNLLLSSLLSSGFSFVVVGEPLNNSAKHAMRCKNLRNILRHSAQIFANNNTACASCFNSENCEHCIYVVVHIRAVSSTLSLWNPP